jgi:hypothetical protein
VCALARRVYPLVSLWVMTVKQAKRLDLLIKPFRNLPLFG